MKARRITANGKPSWVVPLGTRQGVGKRTRVFGRTKEEAERRAQDKIEELRSHGSNLSDISSPHRSLILQWRDRLTVDQMEDAFRTYSMRNPTALTVVEAVEKFRSEREPSFSKQHAAAMRTRFRRVVAEFNDRAVGDLQTGELEDFISAQGASALNYYRALTTFFGYARRHRWLGVDPMGDVKRPEQKIVKKLTFKTAEMHALLAASAGFTPGMERHEPTLALIVLSGLCGLRYTEALRLRWDQVDLESGEIHLEGLKTSKRGLRERFVNILPAADSWLRTLKKSRDGRVVTVNDKNARRQRSRIVRAAGLRAWPHNVLRRSWASYHLAAFESPDLTAAQAGHTSAETTIAKYRTLARKADGVAWFGLTLESCVVDHGR